MPTLSPPVARCDVYTFKEGLLSAVGHDVMLTVERFEAKADGERLTATFETASLTVVAATKDGVQNPGALSEKDKATIEGYVREDILHARRYPKVTFTLTSSEPDDDQEDAFAVEGTLDLHGRSRTVRGTVVRKGDVYEARAKIHQPDFGITPFRAMLGTLRIQATVEVVLTVPIAAVSDLLANPA